MMSSKYVQLLHMKIFLRCRKLKTIVSSNFCQQFLEQLLFILFEFQMITLLKA